VLDALDVRLGDDGSPSDPHLPRAVGLARSCTYRQRQLSEVDVANRELTKFVQP